MAQIRGVLLISQQKIVKFCCERAPEALLSKFGVLSDRSGATVDHGEGSFFNQQGSFNRLVKLFRLIPFRLSGDHAFLLSTFWLFSSPPLTRTRARFLLNEKALMFLFVNHPQK